ncbi:MAG: DUF2076 domain-containing protein [Hyphomicrobiaceae bacterium]|jgi:hypothetical protein
MTPEERQLIAGLFDRMRSYGLPEKDREAEALINQSVRANPDAPYMLVQSVLVQEQALQAANDRVTQLEDELRELRGDARAPARSGGFLSGVWGGGRREEPRSSVPTIGARSAPAAWSQSAPQQQPAQAQQQPTSGGGGGFMKSALATAAGVAGGMLLADSIRSMMTGGAHASPAATETTEYVDERDNDPGTYDASNDPGFDSDAGGGDIEI